jgi:hypothetical protein
MHTDLIGDNFRLDLEEGRQGLLCGRAMLDGRKAGVMAYPPTETTEHQWSIVVSGIPWGRVRHKVDIAPAVKWVMEEAARKRAANAIRKQKKKGR